MKTYVVIFRSRNGPFTRLHKNKKHTALNSEMVKYQITRPLILHLRGTEQTLIFWGSQGVKLGWKLQPYKIRVWLCEALIQLYHISSKYKGNLEHMNMITHGECELTLCRCACADTCLAYHM